MTQGVGTSRQGQLGLILQSSATLIHQMRISDSCLVYGYDPIQPRHMLLDFSKDNCLIQNVFLEIDFMDWDNLIEKRGGQSKMGNNIGFPSFILPRIYKRKIKNNVIIILKNHKMIKHQK